MNNKPLRFALMLDSFSLKNWQWSCIEKILNETNAELTLVLLNGDQKTYQASKHSLGFRYLDRLSKKHELFQTQDFENRLGGIEKISIEKSTDSKESFSSNDLKKIEQHRIDFFLRFGFGIIRGKVLELAPYGIWSFHHGDPKEFRGGPPLFWEMLQGKKSQGFILQQLSKTLDGGYLLDRGEIRIQAHTYLETLASSFELSSNLPAKICRQIQNKSFSKKELDRNDLGPIYKTPNNSQVLRLLFKIFWSKLKFHWNDLFLAEIWNVGIAQSLEENSGDLRPNQVKWAPEQKPGHYIADPFWKTQGDEICCEFFSYKDGRGLIASIPWKAGQFGKVNETAMDGSHFSYPFLFEKDGKNYLLPENFESAGVHLYAWEREKPERKATLIRGNWVDPTLYQHQGTWYLFVSPQAQANQSLHLYFSDDLKEAFQAHPSNPIKQDIRSSRPAGPLYLDSSRRLIRPAQDSVSGYGSAVVLNEVLELSKTNYQEKVLVKIKPDPNSKYPDGLHTYHCREEEHLIDGKKLIFVPASLWFQLKRKLKRIFGA